MCLANKAGLFNIKECSTHFKTINQQSPKTPKNHATKIWWRILQRSHLQRGFTRTFYGFYHGQHLSRFFSASITNSFILYNDYLNFYGPKLKTPFWPGEELLTPVLVSCDGGPSSRRFPGIGGLSGFISKHLMMTPWGDSQTPAQLPPSSTTSAPFVLRHGQIVPSLRITSTW